MDAGKEAGGRPRRAPSLLVLVIWQVVGLLMEGRNMGGEQVAWGGGEGQVRGSSFQMFGS